MKKIFIILLTILFPLICYSMENTYNEGEEELITIIIKKKDLEKVKSITNVCRVFSDNKDDVIESNNHYINPNINVFRDEKDKKKWLAELKISVGIGATYGLINNEFDVGPTISVGYEFTF